MLRFWLGLFLILCFNMAKAENRYYVVIYSPGENWNVNLAYDQQDGIVGHREYLDSLFERRILLMSGPMADQPGSMMILVEQSLEAVETIARNDPGVSSHLLVAGIARWQVRMNSLTPIRRAVPAVDASGSFTVERYDSESAINLPEN